MQACVPDGSAFGPCQCDEPTDGSTGAVETTGTDSAGETTGGPSVCEDYEADPTWECDRWLQNCPPGEKCMPWTDDVQPWNAWNAWRCTPLDGMPDSVGEPCRAEGYGNTGIDSCEEGAMCWELRSYTASGDYSTGTCVARCNGCPDAATCAQPSHRCTNDGILNLCLPVCDPLLQDCVEGDNCFPVGEIFTCFGDYSGESGVYGDTCPLFNHCDPGLVCVEAAAVPDCFGPECCTEICSLSDPAGNAQCSGQADGQTCQPWFQPGTAPDGYEDVGFCTLL